MITVERITNGYNNILEVVDFVVGRTSESLAEILTKALPLVAPVPNAVSVFFISQTVLGYNTVQALAVSASVECMFFALTEVVLKSWDLWRNNRRTVVPLAISVVSFIVYFALVMSLVYILEVAGGHSIAPMAFPVVSVVAAVALGVTRWHKHTEQVANDEQTVSNLVSQMAQLRTQHSQQVANMVSEHETVVHNYDKQVANMTKQIAQLSETVDGLNKQVSQQKPDATQRRETLLERVRNNVELNVKQLSDEFGVSQTVIRRDLGSFDKLQFSAGD